MPAIVRLNDSEKEVLRNLSLGMRLLLVDGGHPWEYWVWVGAGGELPSVAGETVDGLVSAGFVTFDWDPGKEYESPRYCLLTSEGKERIIGRKVIPQK